MLRNITFGDFSSEPIKERKFCEHSSKFLF